MSVSGSCWAIRAAGVPPLGGARLQRKPHRAGWPAYEETLKSAKVKYTAYIYAGVNHGFHNDTTPRYDEAAAKLAWQRTIDFFKATLR
jgi:dienelactone hydrolase